MEDPLELINSYINPREPMKLDKNAEGPLTRLPQNSTETHKMIDKLRITDIFG